MCCWFCRHEGVIREAEAQHCERPEEAIGEGAASGVVEASGLGLKGSWREVETWHPVAGSESLKRTQEAKSLKVQPRLNRDPSILEMPVPQDDHQVQQQLWGEPPVL